MSEQAGDGSPTIRDDIPFPIKPRKKAAILIAIILLSIIQIFLGAISLPFIYRHSGYGRRGAWTRPWNQDGVPGMAVFNGVLSLVVFGGNSLSELHPRHRCYSRVGTMIGAGLLLWSNGVSLFTDALRFAWHFLSFGKEDRDAYWLGVWTVCIIIVVVANVTVTFTYCIVAGQATKTETAETSACEMREADPLLTSAECSRQIESPEITSQA